MPAVVPEPPAAAARRRFLRRGGRRRARRIPCMPSLQTARSAGGGPVGREDSPRLRLPRERRRASVARDAGPACGRQPVSFAAQFQAPCRRLAARICRGVPVAQRQAAAAAGRRRHRRDARRRLRIEQPVLRTRGAEAGDVAVEDEGSLARWTKEILTHLAGRRPRLDLPLDVQATAFQWQVWEALRAIPYGETRTYGEIAKTIGRPRAVRAVARACATNPVALAIPCHRVVSTGGGASGYRWGANRKKALLARERDR